MYLSPRERVALIAHETWHIAFNHLTRVGKRDFRLWNMAGDYVINCMLKNNGYSIHPNWLYDPQFDGWSTEQVYEYLEQSDVEVPDDFEIDLYPTEDVIASDITDIVVKATEVARMSGSFGEVPQEIARLIDELLNPQLSWTELLYRYMDEKVKELQSWKIPNKKYLPLFYLPTKYNESLGSLTVAIDTSGSISKETLTSIISEINYVNKTYKPSELTIIDCDSKIHNEYKIDEYDEISELKFTGGGGTSGRPVINYGNKTDTQLLIYFTDGIMNLNLQKPDYQFLWVIYNNPKFKAPFGDVVFIRD